jgi:hypothetical protein
VTVGTPGNGFDQIQNLQPLPPHRKTEPDAKPSIVGLPSTEQGSSLKSIFTKLSSRNGPVPSTNAHNAECATLPRCTELRSGLAFVALTVHTLALSCTRCVNRTNYSAAAAKRLPFAEVADAVKGSEKEVADVLAESPMMLMVGDDNAGQGKV